jgi:hypothetical protein
LSTPRNTPCPFCKAKKGQECTHPSTGVKVFTHPARIKAARPEGKEWSTSKLPWEAFAISQAAGTKIRIRDAEGNVIATMNGPAAEANASAIVRTMNEKA